MDATSGESVSMTGDPYMVAGDVNNTLVMEGNDESNDEIKRCESVAAVQGRRVAEEVSRFPGTCTAGVARRDTPSAAPTTCRPAEVALTWTWLGWAARPRSQPRAHRRAWDAAVAVAPAQGEEEEAVQAEELERVDC